MWGLKEASTPTSVLSSAWPRVRGQYVTTDIRVINIKNLPWSKSCEDTSATPGAEFGEKAVRKTSKEQRKKEKQNYKQASHQATITPI